MREEAREKEGGGSFIDTAGLFYAIGNYAINDVEARTDGKTQSNTKHNTTCRRQCHHLPGASDIVVTNAESYASARYVSARYAHHDTVIPTTFPAVKSNNEFNAE